MWRRDNLRLYCTLPTGMDLSAYLMRWIGWENLMDEATFSLPVQDNLHVDIGQRGSASFLWGWVYRLISDE